MSAVAAREESGWRVVRTPHFDELDNTGEYVIERSAILTIDGDPGVGKSTLVDNWIGRQTLPSTTISVPPQPSGRDIVLWLYDAIAPEARDVTLPHRDLQDDLVELLRTPRIVVIRDAHRLSLQSAGELCWLHNMSGCCPLILEGGPGTGTVIERDSQLRTRIARTLSVAALDKADLLPALQQMHPLFIGAEPELLREVDTIVCRGVFAHWVQFLQTALHIRDRAVRGGKDAPVLDRRLARATIGLLPATITKPRR